MTDIAKLRMEADSSGIRRATGDLRQMREGGVGAERSITGLGKSLLKITGAVAAARALQQQVTAITREASELERQMLRTEAVISATGQTAGFTADQLREQARQLAFATLESTEGIMRAQQVLLTFRSVSGDTFTRATELAADLATVTGGSLTGAMQQLGRALEDPVQGITALRRSGVSFTQDQQNMIQSLVETGDLLGAQTLILDELAQQYGGVARAEAGGLAGAFDTLGQSVQELRLELDTFLGLSGRLESTYNTMSAAVQEFTAIIASGQIQYYIQAIGNEFEYLTKDIRAAMDYASQLIEDAAIFWGQSGVDGAGFITDAFKELVPNIKAFVELAAVELISLVDRSVSVRRAIMHTMDPRNWFGDNFTIEGSPFADFLKEEQRRINAVRLQSITDIDKERQKAIDSATERRKVILENGREVRQEWERQQRELTEMAFVAGETTGVLSSGMSDAADSARDFTGDLRALARTLGTELENAISTYNQQLELIGDAEREGALEAQDAALLRYRAYRDLQDRMTDINERGIAERRRQEERDEAARRDRQMQSLQAAQGFFGNLAQVAEAGGRESFEAYKAMATAEALVAGSLAFIKALSAAPPPFNFALAGSVAAATAVQMAQIQGQTYKQRAMGGQVAAGDSVLVGENGPEWLRMGGAGHVTPSHRSGTSNEVNVTPVFQISTGVAETAQAEIMRYVPYIVEACKNAVVSAVSQGGSMSRAVGRKT